MQHRSIILAVLGMLVTVAFVKLVWDSQGAGATDVDSAELESALNSYERSAANNRPAPATDIPIPRRKPNIGTMNPKSEAGQPAETYTAPPPREQEEVFTEPLNLKNQMNDANRLYDKADYEGARDAAIEILNNTPENVRMQRIVVSSSCIMGEEEMAQKYYQDLPPRDQRQMGRRCKRYGIDFEEE